MRLLLFALAIGLTATLVFAKKTKSLKKTENEEKGSNVSKKIKPKLEKKKSQKGSKKQMLGYPEQDDRQSMANSLYGQGGLPAPGYDGGLGNGGLGSEMEGMPTGIGGGGEPLGFRDQDGPPGPDVRIPGIVNGPTNSDDAAEVGRGGDENEYVSRYSKDNDIDEMTEEALSQLNGNTQAPDYENRDRMGNNEEPDLAVTKAIGRPFQPENGVDSQLEQHEDSPFQQVRQENSFQPPMESLASQASFAAQQMSPIRPGFEGGPLGPEQQESPSSQLQQPDQGDQPAEQDVREQETAGFRATSMSGGEALMGMNDQGGMKRHKLSKKARKVFQNATKRKKISKTKKATSGVSS